MVFQRNFIVLTLIFLLFACIGEQTGLTMSVQQLQSRIENAESPLILDVRSKKEYEKGHIQGAVHIPIKQLTDRLSIISDKKSEEIVVYCYVGPRARKVEEILSTNGFSNVIQLTGHFKAWKEANLPIVNSDESG